MLPFLSRFRFVVLATSLIAGGIITPSIAANTTSATLVLPADTTVTLVPAGTGGMAGAHNVGDPVDFTVKNDVIVNGWVVIPKGAPAHGTVADLTSAGVNFGGKFSQASLKFAFDWVQLTSGKLRLDNTPTEVKGRQIKRTVKTIFGSRQTPDMGFDPFMTAMEYGVDAKTTTTVHVTSTQRATALEQAQQTNDYITK